MAESTVAVTLLDAAAKRVLPIPVDSFVPAPTQVAEDLWLVQRKLRFPPALVLSTHMTLLRLASGGLVVHSPLRMDAGLLDHLAHLGPVVAILAPNSFHYSYVAEWMERFPQASFWHAPGLRKRVEGLPDGSVLHDRSPEIWAAEIDQIVYGPIGPFAEVVFLHRPTKTLILSDLAFNMSQFENRVQQLGWRLMGVPSQFGPSRTARLTLLRDREAARPYLRRIAAWDFEQVIVAHGDVLRVDARGQFQRAFANYL